MASQTVLVEPFEVHAILCDGSTMEERFESSLLSWRRYSKLLVMAVGHESLTPNDNRLFPQHIYKVTVIHRDPETHRIKRKVDSEPFACPDHVGKMPTS